MLTEHLACATDRVVEVPVGLPVVGTQADDALVTHVDHGPDVLAAGVEGRGAVGVQSGAVQHLREQRRQAGHSLQVGCTQRITVHL